MDVANTLDPVPFPGLVKGNPGVKNGPYMFETNPNKGVRILGIKYRSAEEMMRDSLVYFRDFKPVVG